MKILNKKINNTCDKNVLPGIKFLDWSFSYDSESISTNSIRNFIVVRFVSNDI